MGDFLVMGSYVKCKLCGVATLNCFNLNFKAVHICEACANAISLQQITWLFTKHEQNMQTEFKKNKESWSFCETPEENCTMNFCDDNGCQNRERQLVNREKEFFEVNPTTDINIAQIRIQLEEFGKVEKCVIENEEIHIIITDGFSANALKTLEFLKVAASLTKYKMIKKCRTDENYCEIILR